MSGIVYDLLVENKLDQMERVLCTNTAIINDSTLNGGETLLMAACVAKNKTAVRILLNLGADANIKCPGHRGEAPIYKTCTLSSMNNLAIARMLIDNGARLDLKTDHEKYTPLHQACFCGRSAVAILLIENGANCNAMNHYNETPLHIALRYGHVTKEVALLMVSKGGDLVGLLDVRGKRPIDYVASAKVREELLSARRQVASATPLPSAQLPSARPRSSSISSTPEKKPQVGKSSSDYICARTPPLGFETDSVLEVIPVRSYARQVQYTCILGVYFVLCLILWHAHPQVYHVQSKRTVYPHEGDTVPPAGCCPPVQRRQAPILSHSTPLPTCLWRTSTTESHGSLLHFCPPCRVSPSLVATAAVSADPLKS